MFKHCVDSDKYVRFTGFGNHEINIGCRDLPVPCVQCQFLDFLIK